MQHDPATTICDDLEHHHLHLQYQADQDVLLRVKGKQFPFGWMPCTYAIKCGTLQCVKYPAPGERYSGIN